MAGDAWTGPVAGGLVFYLATATLHPWLATTVIVLKSAISGVYVGSGPDNNLTEIMAGLPGASLFTSVGRRPNAIKSFVLVTERDEDDPENEAEVGTAIRDVDNLNTISLKGGDEYEPYTSTGAVFGPTDFTGDPSTFFSAFAQARLGEIETNPVAPEPPPVIPVPTSIPLLLSGVGPLGALRLRREA